MTETDKAYIAGFVDGEGCFTVTSRGSTKSGRPSWKPVCMVCNTNPEVLLFIQASFGGSLHTKRVKETHKVCHVLVMSVQGTKNLVHSIAPFLRQKLKVAQLVASFPPRSTSKYDDVTLVRQREIVEAVRAENKRGK